MKKLLTLALALIGAMSMNVRAELFGGACGAALTWSLDSDKGILEIKGAGLMTEYSRFQGAPWYKQREYIKQVSLPEGLLSISPYAFDGCVNLEALIIPEKVLTIGEAAFQECSQVSELIIPKNVTQIEGRTFNKCKALKRIVLPETIISIGEYAFSGCRQLEELMLPEALLTIERYAFDNCDQLKTIVFPAKLQTLSYGIFYDCDVLASITCKALTPPNTESSRNPFDGLSQLTNIRLFVPKEAVKAYQASEYWGKFAEILPIE